MAILFNLILFALVAYAIYDIYLLRRRIYIYKKILKRSKKFEFISDDITKTILVLGDSTAYGIGAENPENTIPGRLFKKEQATYLENHSVSGARILGLERQIKKARLKSYSIILIQIGANNIIRFKSANKSKKEIESILPQLPAYGKLIFLCAGNVGGTKFFPKFMNPYYTRLTLQYHKMFEEVINKLPRAKYVNLYVDPKIDPFILTPSIYSSPDGLHPNDVGYGFWFDKIDEK
jgi:lysophospholipase L1-like esterase